MREDLVFEEAIGCDVGKSCLCNGQGLFALKPFDIGDVVADYSTSEYKWQACKHEDLPQFHKQFMWWTGVDEVYCKIADLNSVFMRANHISNPNTEWLIDKKQLIANKVIFPGEEITYNYTKEVAPQDIKSNPPSWVNS